MSARTLGSASSILARSAGRDEHRPLDARLLHAAPPQAARIVYSEAPGQLALDQLAIMRPLLGYSRYQGPIPGLFLCSAGTHPGGFMSGGSGRMAAREAARFLAA